MNRLRFWRAGSSNGGTWHFPEPLGRGPIPVDRDDPSQPEREAPRDAGNPSGRQLRDSRTQADQTCDAGAFVFASDTGDVCGRSQLLAIGHGAVRSLHQDGPGIPTSPRQRLCAAGVSRYSRPTHSHAETAWPSRSHPWQRRSTKNARFEVRWRDVVLFDNHLIVSSIGRWTGRATQAGAVVNRHSARFAPAFRAFVIASVSVSRPIWFAASARCDRYAIGGHESQGSSAFSSALRATVRS